MAPCVLVIANPVAGAGLAARVRPLLEEDLRRAGFGVRFFETRIRGDAEAEARRADGAAAVVAIGGDGTINEVLNGLMLSSAPPLAVVPAGTANVLAKELGIPRAVPAVERAGEALARLLSDAARRPERVLRPARSDAERVAWITPALEAGRAVRIDLGESNGRRFALMAGAGFDAQIVRILAEERRGPIRMSQYAGWGLKALLRYRPPRVRVVVDGRTAADDASFVIAASSASYGGPFTFAPAARPHDGLLDVVVFRGRGLDDLVRWIGAAWLGRPEADRFCRIVQGREVHLTSEDSVDVQVDGDPAGTLPVTCTILDQALTVLVPLTGRGTGG